MKSFVLAAFVALSGITAGVATANADRFTIHAYERTHYGRKSQSTNRRNIQTQSKETCHEIVYSRRFRRAVGHHCWRRNCQR